MQLVDTNILSELMRPQPNAGVLTWLQGRERVKPRLTISVVTVDEIMFGLSWHPTARLLSWFDAFVQRHEVLPITTDVARRAGVLRRRIAAPATSQRPNPHPGRHADRGHRPNSRPNHRHPQRARF